MICYDPTLPIAHIEIPSTYKCDFSLEDNVYKLTQNIMIQHAKNLDDALLEEIQKTMIENDIPEMYVIDDRWILEAMTEKMERERKKYYEEIS